MWIALALALVLLSLAVLWLRLRRRPVPIETRASCLSMRDTLERRVREGKPPL